MNCGMLIKTVFLILYVVQVFAIESVGFAVDFVPFVVEFVALTIEFGPFAVEFIYFSIEFVSFAVEFGALASEFVTFAQKLIIVTLTATNQLLIARWTIFTRILLETLEGN